ncbi:Hypothetical protein SRAE_1000331900 [Strongyloides ratti]|uniref:Uncharacterized protein n=1 Tax=Strongyloides ratti TaxID=34506 RepID=A0A090L5I9_STRRB|nr:Hypothetical protein SRAE_1000331900 [Strongyloides ratti]CEF65066.1 Hypothetical protein SRAE_1000331900 [Strongyloides ratti]
MNILWKILLSYLLGHINFNIFCIATTLDYECENSTSLVERIVIGLNKHNYGNDETKFWSKTFNDGSNQKFDHSVDLPDGAKFVIKNIDIIGIPLKNVYVDKDDTIHDIHSSFRYYLCPISSIKKNWFYFNNYKKDQPIINLDGTNRCSVGHCEMGLLLYYSNGDANVLKGGGTANRGLYVEFEGGSIYPLLFKQAKSNDKNMALVACPYINWMSKYGISKYQPAEYIKNFFPIIPQDDFDRHRFIPTFKYSSKKLPGKKNANDRDVKVFICGTIKQSKFPDVEVGFDLEKANEQKSFPITFDGTNVLCDSKDIKDDYVFGYIPSDKIVLGTSEEISYFSSENKFYSGQYLLVYNKNEIIERRKELKRMDNGNTPNNEYDSHSWDYGEKFYFNPKCIGEVENIVATLKLKVGDNVVDGVLNQDSNIISHEINEIIGTTTLGCHPFMNQVYDDRFSDFYSKRFKTFIQRIEDENGKAVEEPKKETIEIFDGSKTIFGKYKCTIEEGITFGKIKSSEFIITSKYGENAKNTINALKTDKDVIKCLNKNERDAPLFEMIVVIKTDKTYKYIKKNNINEDFKLTHEYVILKLKDNEVMIDNTKFECIYKKDGVISSRKVVTINVKSDVEKVKGSNSSTLIICGIGAVVVLLLVIIVIVIVVKIKQKQKANLLAKVSDGISTSPMPKKKLNVSKNKSKSKSSKTSSSYSTSKSISNSTSKSNSKSASKSTSKSTHNSKTK